MSWWSVPPSFASLSVGLRVVVYGVWFIWAGLGDALLGASALGGLAGLWCWSSEYGHMVDGSSLCDLVFVEGEECPPFWGLWKFGGGY